MTNTEKSHARAALKSLEMAAYHLRKAQAARVATSRGRDATWSTFAHYTSEVEGVISSDGGECGLRAWLKAEGVIDG